MDILAILRDPIWQFIGAIFGLMALYIARQQFSRKELTYEVTADEKKVSNSLKEGVTILYNGTEVKNLYMTTIRIRNTGNTAIERGHFDKNLAFSFGKNSKVLLVEWSDFAGISVGAYTTSELEDVVYIKPFILNRREYFDISFLTSNKSTVCVYGHIIDTKIARKQQKRKITSVFVVYGLVFSATVAAMFLFKLYHMKSNHTLFDGIILLLASFTMIFSFAGTMEILGSLSDDISRRLKIKGFSNFIMSMGISFGLWYSAYYVANLIFDYYL